MAMIETWFNQELTQAVKVRYLDGNVFSADSKGNRVGVHVFSNGQPAELDGTVSASIIRADGATVAAYGSKSSNRVFVDLPEAAYAVPGTISIVIKLTSGTVITTLCAVVANVYQSSTDSTVDPGTIIPSIETLIAAIDAAIDSIPADYSTLLSALAPNYSSSALYWVGEYVWYSGNLYRCIVPITSSESWTSSHWQAAVIGSDLFNQRYDISTKAGLQFPFFPEFGGDTLANSIVVDDTNHTMTLKAGLPVWTGKAQNTIIVVAADHTINLPKAGKIFIQNDAGTIKLLGCTNGAYATLENDVRETLLVQIAETNNSYAVAWSGVYKLLSHETAINDMNSYGLVSVDKKAVSFIGGVGYPLIYKEQLIAGYYVNYNNGELVESDSYSVTPMIPVVSNLVITVTGGAQGSQVAFYNSSGVYVSGILVRTQGKITVPNNSNIAYMRWCTMTDNINSVSMVVYDQDDEGTVYVTTTKGILEGVMEAYNTGKSKVVVYAGTYDVMQEYAAHFGSDCWANYTTNYNPANMGIYGRGIWLDNIEITFMPGAKVIAHYTGNNDNVKTYFSPFAVGSNAVISGLVVDSTELRYSVHPDFHPEEYERIIFRDCDFHHLRGTDWNEAIGCGFGVHSYWTFENCIFRSDGNYRVFRIHNVNESGAQSLAIVKNCYIYGQGYMEFQNHGPSTAMSTVEVSGCSWISPARLGNTAGATVTNMDLIAWNNETRVQ